MLVTYLYNSYLLDPHNVKCIREGIQAIDNLHIIYLSKLEMCFQVSTIINYLT